METGSPSSKKTTHNPSYTPPPPPPVLLSPVAEVAAKDTDVAGSSSAVVVGALEDDKDRIVVEIMQMYSRQQEKLNSTLSKQLQLEMVSRRGQAKPAGRPGLALGPQSLTLTRGLGRGQTWSQRHLCSIQLYTTRHVMLWHLDNNPKSHFYFFYHIRRHKT